MKREPFSLLRGWQNLRLQSRLFLVFTILFAFCALVLSLLLNNVIQMIRINQETQKIFETNRQASRLQAVLMEYQLALQYYENSSSYQAEMNLATLQDQIIRERSLLERLSNEDPQATDAEAADGQAAVEQETDAQVADAQLKEFNSTAKALKTKSTQIVDAVKNADAAEEGQADWNSVVNLHTEAVGIIDRMEGLVKNLQKNGTSDFKAINAKADEFQNTSWMVGLAVLPIFLILAILTAVVIDGQINRPLNELSDATRELEKGTFQPQTLEAWTKRSDEVGAIARRFVQMAASINQRTVTLQQVADEIRSRIR